MKLFYSPTSPYARIARIVALESDLKCTEECVDPNVLRTPDNPVLRYNCTGRIPTLVSGDTVVTETRSICRYMESFGNRNSLFSETGDWHAELLESTAVSFLDGCALWTREYRRNEASQSKWLISVERDRAQRTLDWFSSNASIVSGNTPWNFAYITLAVAIDYQAYRGLIPDWANARDALFKWFEEQSERASMEATSLPDR